MASLEDYDEFGNYIGADLDSDEEDEELNQGQYAHQPSGAPAPLEGFDDEPMREPDNEMALMEVDGVSKCYPSRKIF
jgi:U5 small nuclear ribonucleoprotein component